MADDLGIVNPVVDVSVDNTVGVPVVKEKRKLRPFPNDLPKIVDDLMKAERPVKLLDLVLSVPKIIATTVTPDQIPFAGAAANPDIIKQLVGLNVSGAVINGQLVQGPAYQLENPSLGVYKVIHGLGFTDLCISIGAMQQPCTLMIKECAPTYFVVEATLDGDPVDMGFFFTLSRVIS